MKRIAILRGINVGGKRKILMADLRAMMENLGYHHITTYIQSGNVVFEDRSDDGTKETAQRIKDSINHTFGYDVPVMVLTSDELSQAIRFNPFDVSPENIHKLHLTFLSESPDPEKLAGIAKLDFAPDQFEILEKYAFLCCELKYHKTKLNNQFFEKKLGVTATTRNWKTVLKLAEMGE